MIGMLVGYDHRIQGRGGDVQLFQTTGDLSPA
jgi:hypothetical protein